MTEVTLASLAMDFDVRSADPATQKTNDLRAASRALEEQTKATSKAVRDHAVAQGLSGTAAGRVEQSLGPVIAAYGQARDALGRFAQEDGKYRLSQDATAKMLLQNAKTVDDYARQQEQAAKVVAKAEADAARAREADMNATATLLIRNAKLQDDYARQQEQAAASTASYAAKVGALKAQLDPFAAVQLTLAQRTKLLDEAMAHGAITAPQYEDALSQVTRAATSDLIALDKLNKAHGATTGSSRTLSFAMLNLSRQASDFGVGFTQAAASSEPMKLVFMTLVQQGPQVIDVFADLKTQGVGVKSALGEMAVAARGLIVTFGPWIAGLAAVGAGVWYLIDAHNKQAKSLKDLNGELTKQRQELEQISPLILNSGHNADLASDGLKNFDQWLRNTNVSLAEQNKLLRENTLNKLNDQAMKAAEEYSKAQKAFDKINRPGPAMASAGGAGGFSAVAPVQARDPKDNPFYKEAAENLRIAKQSYDAINDYRNKAYLAPEAAFGKQTESATKAAKAVRSVAEAADDYSRHAAPVLEDHLLKASTVVWPEAAAAAEAYKQQQDSLRAATNDNIKTFEEATKGQIQFSSKLQIAAVNMADAAEKARNLRFDVEDIGRAIDAHDWSTAFAGLLNVLDQVKAAFAAGATSAQKFAAVSGLGQGIGSLIGGKTGAGISGAASGAQAGFQLGGPWGAAAGAALGGLAGIIGSSAAKAQAKIEKLMEEQRDLQAKQLVSSGSIANALDVAAKWQNTDIELSNGMLTALRSIDNKIGTLAATVARNIGTGGLLSTNGLGLGSTSSKGSLSTGLIGGGIAGAAAAGGVSALMAGFAGSLALGPIGLVAGAVGALVGALTKTKKTTEVLDQGLQFTASTFDQISKGGVSGASYADLLTTTKKSILGVGLSTKVATSTVTGAIDPAILNQITGVIDALGDGVVAAAKTFGDSAAEAAAKALVSVNIDLGKLSLKGLKPDEIEAAINAVFDKVGDQLAAAGVPGLEDLADVGEGAFATLTRLAREYRVVDVSLASVGKTFGAVGVASLAARDALVDAVGGIDALVSQTSFFAQNFLTDAQQMAPVIKAVNDNLKAYGLSAESTRDQFASLVLAQDLTTEAGRNTYAALLAVAPAFDKVADAADKAAADAKARADYEAGIQDKIDELTLSSSELQLKARNKDLAAAAAYGDVAVALAKKYWDLQDATTAATAAADQAAKDAEATAKNQDVATRAAANAADVYTKAMEEQAAAANASADALAGIVNKFVDLSDTLNKFADSLGTGELSGLSGQAAYTATKARLMASSGEDTPDAIRAFLAASKDVSASDSAYRLDVAFAQSLARQRAGYAMGTAQGFGSLFSSLPGFANGGAFTVGGNTGVDQNVMSINNQPVARVNYGEPVRIGGGSNDNSMAAALRDMAAELKAVKAQLVAINGNTADTATNTEETHGFLKNGTLSVVQEA